MNALGKLQQWISKTSQDVVVHTFRTIDGVTSQVVYTVKGIPEIVIGEYDSETKEMTEISISEETFREVSSKIDEMFQIKNKFEKRS